MNPQEPTLGRGALPQVATDLGASSAACSVMSDSVTPWTAAHQAPLSVGFSRQEYWNGLPSPSPGDLPHPGIEPGSPALQANSLPSELPGKPNLSFCGWLFSFSVLSSGFIHVVARVDFCLLLCLNGAYTLCVFCTMSKVLFQP